MKLPKARQEVMDSGWEAKRLDHMKKNIGKGDVVYYVGAECGDMPGLCQSWGAEVAIFEPAEHFWQDMKKIWQMNDFEDPMFFWGGFASNTNQGQSISWEEIDMEKKYPDYLGFGELSKEAARFPQITIDEAVKRAKKPPTAMSIDVEGAEFEVLKGARETLKQYKPKIYLSLHPEFLFDQWGVYGNDVRNYLKDLGYKETLIEYPAHEVHFFYE